MRKPVGYENTLYTLIDRFYLPQMRKDIKEYVYTCRIYGSRNSPSPKVETKIFIEAILLRSIDARTTSEAFLKELVLKYGIPHIVPTDKEERNLRWAEVPKVSKSCPQNDTTYQQLKPRRSTRIRKLASKYPGCVQLLEDMESDVTNMSESNDDYYLPQNYN
ncbi:hypothetical protein RF11_14137 [Thelohanellus kitauei]|uniref:Integrase zinc-binding domain-containing protein n=1 Tax=Thelohanellus kitauei TaxID=669202 RepID=A0A0C2NEE0_THEKT|nr:hypothetical protein RF11_14137 [Thelohanellus kitauei]